MDSLFIIIPIVFFVIIVTVVIIGFISVIKSAKATKMMIEDKQSEEGEIDLIETIKRKLDKGLNSEKYIEHCEYCGAELKDNETKCSSCGATKKRK